MSNSGSASRPASSPFSLLGLSAGFDLDAAALQRAWLDASARLHPDRAGSAAGGAGVGAGNAALDEADRVAAIAQVNEARAILTDPARRAEALLAVLGGPAKEADKSLPEGFLVDMLAVREEMQEAAGDAAEMAKWESWAQKQREGYIQAVGELFLQAQKSSARDDAALRAIRMELNAWRYIDRMIEQIDG